jgi:hypothetical protein
MSIIACAKKIAATVAPDSMVNVFSTLWRDSPAI